MKIRFIQIAILAGLTAGCRAQRMADPVAENPAKPEHKTVEFTQKSDSDLRDRTMQWQEDGWAINSLSARLSQPDGSIHRRAELTRASHPAVSNQYDDRRIARIRVGKTVEDDLIDWFGHPQSRSWSVDGRTSLTWCFQKAGTQVSEGSGMLAVSLASDGKVDSYSAHRPKFNTQETKDIGFKYDDSVIAKIGRGETSEEQLLEWFGRPISRQTGLDHRTSLAWQFASQSGKDPHPAGALQVSLTPDGKVDAYGARQAAD